MGAYRNRRLKYSNSVQRFFVLSKQKGIKRSVTKNAARLNLKSAR